MTAYEHAFSMQEVYTWLGRQQARYIRYGFGLWALLDAGTGVFVGQVGLTIQDTPGGPELEIGYLLKRRFWHRGYAVRAGGLPGFRVYEFGGSPGGEHHPGHERGVEKGGGTNRLRPESTFVKRYYGMDMPHIVYALDRGDFYKNAGKPDGQ